MKVLQIMIILSSCLIIFTGCVQCPDCVQESCPTCPEQKECPNCVCPEFDKSLCPVIEQNTTIIKYIYMCNDGREVDSKSDCTLKQPDLVPVTDNEAKSTLIDSVTMRAACVDAMQGGEIYFNVLRRPISSKVQMDSGDGFKDVIDLGTLQKGYQYFRICMGDCPSGNSKFSIEPEKAYLMRLKFDFGDIGGIHLSNEHLIDARTGGKYYSKNCS